MYIRFMKLILLPVAIISVIGLVGILSGEEGNPKQPDAKKLYTWLLKSPKASPEPRRVGHAITYDSNRKVTVLFGGRLSDKLVYLNDTWEWNDLNWKKIETKTKPPERYYFAMVYDTARKKVVLFGGNNTGGEKQGFADTWEYDGNDWIEMKPEHSPPARFCHAMTYDSDRKVTVLVGGRSGWGDHKLRDHWEWDGAKADWKEISSKTRLPLRDYHALAYDPERKVTVLFGGDGGRTWSRGHDDPEDDPRFEDDTWEYDNQDWQKKSPEHAPTPRFTHAMVYYPPLKKIILFAGIERSYFHGNWMNDTWAWDGTDWEKLSPEVSPPPRNHHYLAYDSDRQVIVLFGGWSSTGGLEDTWEYGTNK